MARLAALPAGPHLVFTAIDTMKESRDTETRPLSDAQIADDVRLSASLHPLYAIRATGLHVWFRIHNNQWEDSNGATGIETPAAYLAMPERRMTQ